MSNLRPYQTDLIEMAAAAVLGIEKGLKAVVLQASTGSGKTFTAAEIIKRCNEKGKRALFLCDTLELIEQAIKAFDAYGLDLGVIQAQHERTCMSKLLQVCSQNTLVHWLKNGRFENYKVDLVILDECHLYTKARDVLAEMYPNAVFLGLSATPFSKSMGNFYQDIVSAVLMRELIDDGYLCDYLVYAPSQPNMKGTKKSGHDWQPDEARKKYTSLLVADIIDTWKKRGKGKPTLMFCCNVAHSKEMCAEFQAVGINAVHVDGYQKDEDEELTRKEKFAAYDRGEIEILSSVALCTKGFDSPHTECLIIARPTASLSLHHQMIGRALRIFDGKESATILDHAGNTLRHGFPTDIEEFELNDDESTVSNSDKREKGEKLPVPCQTPGCGFMKPPGVFVCPMCSCAPTKETGVKNVDGELVPINKSPKTKQMINPDTKMAFTDKDKSDWMKMFRQVEISGGKKRGYANHLYREKFKSEPANPHENQSLAITKGCKNWVTHINMRRHYDNKT